MLLPSLWVCRWMRRPRGMVAAFLPHFSFIFSLNTPHAGGLSLPMASAEGHRPTDRFNERRCHLQREASLPRHWPLGSSWSFEIWEHLTLKCFWVPVKNSSWNEEESKCQATFSNLSRFYSTSHTDIFTLFSLRLVGLISAVSQTIHVNTAVHNSLCSPIKMFCSLMWLRKMFFYVFHHRTNKHYTVINWFSWF